MAKLKKVGVLFLAKLLTIIMVFIGIIAGTLYAVGGAIYDVLTTNSVHLGTALAFLALLGMPIIFGLVGFLAGVIGALIYNIVARWFGGIELEIDHD